LIIRSRDNARVKRWAKLARDARLRRAERCAIIEGPQGSVFFKFTGPAKTVAQNQAAFDKLLASLSL